MLGCLVDKDLEGLAPLCRFHQISQFEKTRQIFTQEVGEFRRSWFQLCACVDKTYRFEELLGHLQFGGYDGFLRDGGHDDSLVFIGQSLLQPIEIRESSDHVKLTSRVVQHRRLGGHLVGHECLHIHVLQLHESGRIVWKF